jgi:hypothetical protein
MTDACTLLQVKQRMTGDAPVMDGSWDTTIGDAITMVTSLINEEVAEVRGQPEGWAFVTDGVPVTRRYTARGGTPLVLVDDAVAVAAVSILDKSGNTVQVLARGADWLPSPLNTLPITGLRLLNGLWPDTYAGVSVTLTPGYATVWPPDVVNAAIAEVIRTVRGGQAGEDDRLGITPFGSVVTSKALLQSTVRVLHRYRYGGVILRGPS